MKTAEEISNLRKKHNLTQEQLASLLGVSFTTVNAWELSKREPQAAMSKLLEQLFKSKSLDNFKNSKDEVKVGMSRTGAGFVSSVLAYNGQKDSYPLTHGIGRWYGCLPSHLVHDLVRFCATDLNKSGNALVNFSGSGTAALEFADAGFKTSSIDINPAAIFLSHIKTQKISPLNDVQIEELVSKLIKSNLKGPLRESPDKTKNLMHNQDRWISGDARSMFQQVLCFVNSQKNFEVQLILTTALLNICIDFCQIDKRCTNHYVFKENKIIPSTFFSELKKELVFINNKLHSLFERESYVPPELHLCNNQKTPFDDESFDIVFAHPPYSTMINYYSMSRVQQSLIEMVEFDNNVFNEQIHSTLKLTQANDQSASTPAKFYSAIDNWVAESSRLLTNKGYLIVIIGDNRDKGYLSHPHTEIIRAAESASLKLKEMFIWVTENKAGMHVKRKGHHIDHNYILVLEKP